MTDWEDTNKAFSDVSTDRYLEALGDHTFITEKVGLSTEEGEAMVRKHLKKPKPEDRELLRGIEQKLDPIIRKFNGRAFVKMEDLSPKDQAHVDLSMIPSRPIGNTESNYHLKMILQKKAASLSVASGMEALELLTSSKRCMLDEMIGRKGYHGEGEGEECPAPVSILVREWAAINPEMELRGFVIDGNLQGLSQMATMGIAGVHSDYLLQERSKIGESARRFFNDSIKPLLQNTLSVTTYVLDLAITDTSTWKVIELNPFSTSMEGHLFVPFPKNWVDGSADPLQFEFRLHPFTSACVLSDPEMPAEWVEFLETTDDEYGDQSLSPFSLQPSGSFSNNECFDMSIIIVAGRYPVKSVGFDPGEVHDFLIPALRMAQYVQRRYKNENTKITIIARVNAILSQPTPRVERLGIPAWRKLASTPPLLFKVTDHVLEGTFQFTDLTKGAKIRLRPAGKNALYTARITQITKSSVTVDIPGVGVFVYSEASMECEIFWMPATEEAAAVMKRETAVALSKLDDMTDEEIERKRAAYYEELDEKKRETHEREMASLREAASGLDITYDHELVNARTFRKCLQNAFATSKRVLVYLASHGSLPDDSSSSSYINFPYEPHRLSGADFKKIVSRSIERRDCLTTSVFILCGTCYSEGIVEWIRRLSGQYVTVLGLSSADKDKPNTAMFMDAVPYALETCLHQVKEPTVADLLQTLQQLARSGFADESPQPEAAEQFQAHFHSDPSNVLLSSLLPWTGKSEGPILTIPSLPELPPPVVTDAVVSKVASENLPSSVVTILTKLMTSPPVFPSFDDIQAINKTPGEILTLLISLEGCDKETASWIEVMERLEKGGLGTTADTAARGDPHAVDIPFWCKGNGQGSISNQLTYSFELEGHQLRILDFYKQRDISDSDWLKLSLLQRFEQVGSRWVTPLFRMDHTSKAFPYFNHQLHPEANGSCWEIIYSGDTPGYTTDLTSLFSDMSVCLDNGLSLIELQHDSGVQVHVSFSIPRVKCDRNVIVDFLVLASDFLFLKGFEHVCTDDLNVLYTDSNVDCLKNCSSVEDFQKLISSTADCPNPVYKHKIIGCRGRDVYRDDQRMGFEIRRGYADVEDLHHISDMVRVILTQNPDTGTFRFCRGVGADLRRYRLEEFRSYLESRRVPESEWETCWEGIDITVIDEFLAPFYLSMTSWNHQNTSFKTCVSHSWSVPPSSLKQPPSEGAPSDRMTVLRTFAFVLLTDWSVVPHPAAASARDEQLSILQQLRSLRDVQNEQARGVKLEYLRLHTVEFARRLARMF
eukprot:TRINITY_DN1471_c3_g1_i2.p1 TRINITY_DN1471_c3_g1~~TRINITY_DN1471_c3_g1_i2.p1  ORF type:complete len:1285 (+),score=229.39 TRINITY_DN1471_c3_g1_i2:229-4083(+)